MVTFTNRIRRALGLSWEQVNDTRRDPESPWDIVTWRCARVTHPMQGIGFVLTVQPKAG